ncbi:MAG: flagellar biosynthetic protein FliR [Caulobacteraceae bacterium]|nr:flagellar biosynthetic protein FliR [Caulobacteraceae bacterium]
MQPPEILAWVLSCALLSLRVSPVFALAPPFTLTRVPAQFRLLFGVAIAAGLVAAHPAAAALGDLGPGALVVVAARELFLGAIFVAAFQLMFAALYLAGRTLDIQAGFGLALLLDPTSQAQTPMIGTFFAYAAAVVFFAMGGPGELLRILGASLEAVPLAAGQVALALPRLTAFIATVFVAGFGVGGGAILCLFLADLAIALLSRTVPQMNVLILGLQVKTLILLLILPAVFGVAAALLARMGRMTLEALPGLMVSHV